MKNAPVTGRENQTVCTDDSTAPHSELLQYLEAIWQSIEYAVAVRCTDQTDAALLERYRRLYALNKASAFPNAEILCRLARDIDLRITTGHIRLTILTGGAA